MPPPQQQQPPRQQDHHHHHHHSSQRSNHQPTTQNGDHRPLNHHPNHQSTTQNSDQRPQNHQPTIQNSEDRPQNHRPPHYNHHSHHSNHHPYYQTSSSSSKASLKGCCCCLFLLFSFLALLLLAIFLVIILAVKPKKPQFDLQQVGVQYMGISTSNPTLDPLATGPTTASLTLTIHMLFTAVNPNKVGIKYGESKFTVMYHGVPLGKATVPGFYQEAHTEKQVEATISVDRYSLMQANAADLIRDASLNDRVELRVLGEVGAKIRVLDFDSPGVQVSVNCAIAISPRKQTLTYKDCGFDGLNV